MAKVKMTVEIEFEATSAAAAKAAAIRLQGDIAHGLRSGSGTGFPTNVAPDSIRVAIAHQSIED